jgi:hypothetical protein
MLVVVPAAWLAIAGFFVALCRMAHGVPQPSAESRAVRVASPLAEPHTVAAGLVVWEQEPPDVERELRRLMLRGRGAPPRGAQSAA